MSIVRRTQLDSKARLVMPLEPRCEWQLYIESRGARRRASSHNRLDDIYLTRLLNCIPCLNLDVALADCCAHNCLMDDCLPCGVGHGNLPRK